jgi:DNA primase catalytic core
VSPAEHSEPRLHRPDDSGATLPDDLRGRLTRAHEQAAVFFTEQLSFPNGKGPRNYLERRGVGALLGSPDWSIGYAPPGWTGLTGHLRLAGFTDEELVLAGLGVATRHGTVVDRFQDRVTFGIRNPTGELVGFTGRSAPGTPGDVPKYLNTPATAIYDKGAVLFGLAEQHPALAAGATPVLVEGPFDVLAVAVSHQDRATPLAAVAACGTALTSTQALALRAASDSETLVVGFDSDRAGDRAAAAAYELLRPHFARLRAIQLLAGSDPAELLAHHGPGQLRAALADTQPLADRVVDRILRRYRDRDDNAEARVAALHEIAPVVAAMPPTEVGREVARVARALRFEHGMVTEKVTTALTEQPPSRNPPTSIRHGRPSTAHRRTGASAPSMRMH